MENINEALKALSKKSKYIKSVDNVVLYFTDNGLYSLNLIENPNKLSNVKYYGILSYLFINGRSIILYEKQEIDNGLFEESALEEEKTKLINQIFE